MIQTCFFSGIIQSQRHKVKFANVFRASILRRMIGMEFEFEGIAKWSAFWKIYREAWKDLRMENLHRWRTIYDLISHI